MGIGEVPLADANDRLLLREFVRGGEVLPGWTGAEGVVRATRRHHDSIQEMPGIARRLHRGEPVIPTEYVDES